MAYQTIIKKLTLLKYDRLSSLTSQSSLSFGNMTHIIHFLEQCYLCRLEEVDRVQIAPVEENGDVVMWKNNITNYFLENDINAPQIIMDLIPRTIPPAEGSGKKDEMARMQLCTFLISRAVQDELQDRIVAGIIREKDNTATHGPDVPKNETTQQQQQALLEPEMLQIQKSITHLDGQGNVKLFSDGRTATEFNLSQFNTNIDIVEVIPVVAEVEKDAATADSKVEKAKAEEVESKTESKTDDVLQPLPTQSSKTTQTAKKSAPPAPVVPKKPSEVLAKYNILPKYSDVAVQKALDKLTQTSAHTLAKISQGIASSLTLFATIPINIAAPLTTMNDGDAGKNIKTKKGPGNYKNNKNNKNIAVQNVPKVVTTMPIFDITFEIENEMSLWQYILYISSLYAYTIPITMKAKLYFQLPQELLQFTKILTALNTLDQPLSIPEAHKTTPKSSKPSKSLITTLSQITNTPDHLYTLAKATHLMLLSLVREFSRKVQNEFTTTVIALKNFEPIASSDLNQSLVEYYNEVVPEGKLKPLKKNGADKNGKNENNNVKNGQNVDQVRVIMPSHIFPSINANPNALKKAAKEFNDAKYNKDKNGKGKKDGQQSGSQNSQNSQNSQQKVEETTTMADSSINPLPLPPVADLSKIKQVALKNERFAKRSAGITDYINHRYHLGKLLSIAMIDSQSALHKLATLATLPLGAIATQHQQEQLAAFGKAAVDAGNAVTNSSANPVPKEKEVKMDEEKNEKNKKVTVVGTTNIKQSQNFIAILTTLMHLLYDQQLQQQQAIITRWIQYLQTFTARTSHTATR